MTQVFKLFTSPIFEGITYGEQLDEKTNTKKFFIEGLGLRGNIKNRNNRIYPSDILEMAISKHINENFDKGRCLGELDHPKNNGHDINPDRISHKFVDIKKNGDEWYLKAEVLNTTCGTQLRSLIEGGVGVGFSSRSLGSVSTKNGTSIVNENLKIVSLADAVINPSLNDSVISAIYESKEYIYENGVLIEKDLSEDLDEYQKLIKTTKKSDRAKVFKAIVEDYFRKIKLNV